MVLTHNPFLKRATQFLPINTHLFSSYMKKHLYAFAATIIFFIALLPHNSLALTDNLMPKVVRLEGVITSNTAVQLNQQLLNWNNLDPIPAGLMVLLNSPGGDGEAAMKIGRLLRSKKAQVFVIGQCESACVFVMAGGVVRAANPGTIGIHAGRITMTNQQGKILKEVDSSHSLTNSFRLTSFNSEAHKYFTEMGFSPGFLDAMLSHQTIQTYKLSESEMREYRVIGFENQYLRERAEVLENMAGANRVNRIAFFNRTLSVPSICQPFSSNKAFIDCYKSTLFGLNPR